MMLVLENDVENVLIIYCYEYDVVILIGYMVVIYE